MTWIVKKCPVPGGTRQHNRPNRARPTARNRSGYGTAWKAVAVMLMLGGCAGSEREAPVGIGTGVNEMKRSPCACIEIPQHYPDGYREMILRSFKNAGTGYVPVGPVIS